MSENVVLEPPRREDHWRSLSYILFTAWAVTFLIFTPVSFENALDAFTILSWLGSTLIGGAAAFFGSVFRIDIKLELPGLIFMLVGPGFYALVQLWYSISPAPGTADPQARYHLVVLALYMLSVHLHRISRLQTRRRQIRKNRSMGFQPLPPLTPEQEAQPGAFPELAKDGEK